MARRGFTIGQRYLTKWDPHIGSSRQDNWQNNLAIMESNRVGQQYNILKQNLHDTLQATASGNTSADREKRGKIIKSHAASEFDTSGLLNVNVAGALSGTNILGGGGGQFGGPEYYRDQITPDGLTPYQQETGVKPRDRATTDATRMQQAQSSGGLRRFWNARG